MFKLLLVFASSFCRTSFVHDTGLLNPPMPGEASEEGGTLHLNSLQKGTNMSSRSLTFHSHLTRQCCAQGRAKDGLQSSEGATVSVQSLTAKPSFRRLGGSPEGKSLTTCSGKAWPEGKPMLRWFYGHLVSSIHPFLSPLLQYCQHMISYIHKMYCTDW